MRAPPLAALLWSDPDSVTLVPGWFVRVPARFPRTHRTHSR